jgi:hypothetical protein
MLAVVYGTRRDASEHLLSTYDSFFPRKIAGSPIHHIPATPFALEFATCNAGKKSLCLTNDIPTDSSFHGGPSGEQYKLRLLTLEAQQHRKVELLCF